MSNKKIVEELKKVLADSYSLFIKTQNYHWNVEGPQFNSLHMMFETQYTDLFAAIDEIAERIRALGSKAPGTFISYNELSEIQDGDEDAKAKDMVKDLADDQETIIKTLKGLATAASEEGDEVSLDLAIQRMTVHEKNAWMLKSSL